MCPSSPAISCTLLRNNLHLGCRLCSRGRWLPQDYTKNAGGASDWTSAKRNCGQWLAFFGRPASYGAEATGLIETIIADSAKLEVSTLVRAGRDQPFSDMGRKCGNREAEAVQAEQDAQSSFPPQCSGIDGRAEMGGAFRPPGTAYFQASLGSPNLAVCLGQVRKVCGRNRGKYQGRVSMSGFSRWYLWQRRARQRLHKLTARRRRRP